MSFLSLNGLSYFLNEIKKIFAPVSHTHTRSGITDFIDTPDQYLQLYYPVGAIYMSTNSPNPNTVFGFGTWVQIKDRFLLAAGDTYTAGDTGGESSVSLTLNEIPSHSHTFSNGVITEGTNGTNLIANNNKFGAYNAIVLNNTDDAGGNEAHNNMPPYLTVYIWERVA